MEQFTDMEMKLVSLMTMKQVWLKDREYRKLCNGDYSHSNIITVIAQAWPELASFVKTLPDAKFPQHGFGYTLPENRIVSEVASKLVGILPYMILRKCCGKCFTKNMYTFAKEFIAQIKEDK